MEGALVHLCKETMESSALRFSVQISVQSAGEDDELVVSDFHVFILKTPFYYHYFGF